jgi:putative hydrolase of the HAD superfamily
MPRPRLISFDAAGTLIHVREPVGETYAMFGRKHGIHASPAALKSAFKELWLQVPPPLHPEGQGSPDDDRSWWHEFARAVFSKALGESAPLKPFDDLFDDLYRHYANAEAWEVFADVPATLKGLVKRQRLCVLSNFDRRLLSILEGHRIDRYFEHVVLSSEVGAAKPDARMFLIAQRLFGYEPHECLHVGDDFRCDVQGALAQGWQAYQVARPQSGLKLLLEKVLSE